MSELSIRSALAVLVSGNRHGPVTPEARERARGERSHDRNVGRIAPACHQDAADARLVVAPAVTEIDDSPWIFGFAETPRNDSVVLDELPGC